MRQGAEPGRVKAIRQVHLRYEGTDSPLIVDFSDRATMVAAFEAAHHQQYGFIAPRERAHHRSGDGRDGRRAAEVTDLEIEVRASEGAPDKLADVRTFMAGAPQDTAVYDRDQIKPGGKVRGPAVIVDANATTAVEPGWEAEVSARDHLIVTRVVPRPGQAEVGTEADPVMLEVFNNLFMSIAEQTGLVLQNTSYSVNIKERLDFSCAVFNADGDLIANAPHIPVHLGAMSESVKTVAEQRKGTIVPGDVFMLNTPYNGGTHLPDITVITPVFDDAGRDILFYVASRGHHAEIGGITPGSVPPNSKHIDEEGVLIDNFLLVSGGRLMEQDTEELFKTAPYPTRNFHHNLADLKAQIAANEKGVQELRKMVAHFGLDVVQAYMIHVQNNAEESVRRVLRRAQGRRVLLRDGFRRQDPRRHQGRPEKARGGDRLHRDRAAAGQQLQCAFGRRHGGGTLCFSTHGGRRHSVERRLPEAAEDHHSRRLHAQSLLSRRRGRGQRRDLTGDHRHTVGRVGPDGAPARAP